MDTSKILRGGDLMLFVKDGTGYTSIAFATNHTVTVNAEAAEISCKDAGIWGASIVNKLSWEIQSENLYCTQEYSKLFDLMTAREAVEVTFGVPTENAAKKLTGIESPTEAWHYNADGEDTYKGKAVITSLTLNAQDGDNATFSCTLTGVGSYNKVKTA